VGTLRDYTLRPSSEGEDIVQTRKPRKGWLTKVSAGKPYTAPPYIRYYGVARIGGTPWDRQAGILLKSDTA